MAQALTAAVLDGTLAQIRGECDLMTVCSQQPTTYTQATSTYKLADVAMTINSDYTLANGASGGRKVTVAAKNSIPIDSSGTATHIALCKSGTSELRAVTTCSSLALTAGGTIDIPAWAIAISDPGDPLGPLVASGRTILDGLRQPVLLVGDAAWSLAAQLTNAEIDTYLEDRASRGFNCVMFNVLEHLFADNAPSNIDNVSPWTGATWTTPNDTYMDRVDYALQAAYDLGIYVLLAPLYLGASGSEEGWDTEVAAASTGTMTGWGEYCATRWGGFPNLIWQIGGDQDPTSVLSKVNAFVTGLRNIDTEHLITFHDARGTVASDNLAGATWLTLNNWYSVYLEVPSLAETAYADTPTLPIFQIEGWYENEHSMTAQGLRAQAYWSVLGGGVGHIFGNTPIWNFGSISGDWVAALDDAGSVGMTHFGALFNAHNWSTLIPDSAHGFLTSGYGTLGNADFAGAAKNSAGTLGVIYMPSNRTMAVDMSDMAGTTTARWFDPTNGSYTNDAASPLANTGSHNFSRATNNNAGAADWVLVLTA